MSNIQQIQPEKKIQVKFTPGHDYELDQAMKSLDDMYSDMFDSDSQRVPQSDENGIDDMYAQMMGTKSKTVLREEKITQEQIRVDLWNQSEPVQGFPVYIQQNNPYPAAPQYNNVPQNQYMGYPQQYQQPMYPYQQQQMNNPYQQQQMNNPYQQQQMNNPYQQQQMHPQTQNSNISAQYYYPQAPGNQQYPNPQYPDQPKQF